MDRVPETRFARSGKRRIAYQVAGEGPVDLVFRGSWFLPVDTVWEWEPSAAFRGRLASFSRLVMFDRPGAGATDPLRPGGASEVEAWSDDLLAVLDEIGCTRAALLGSLDGGLFCHRVRGNPSGADIGPDTGGDNGLCRPGARLPRRHRRSAGPGRAQLVGIMGI
jgi:hypothetical protein